MRDIRRSTTSRVESATARSDCPVNPLPPEHMTAAQRRSEIASLLAKGLIRLRSASGPQSLANVARENGFELAFSGHQRVHSHPVHKE
jgi:hypothetical protein